MAIIANEDDKTVAVAGAQSWMDLKSIVKEFAPFISYSRSEPVEWSAEDIMKKMEMVRKGGPLSSVTRANGLRAKVAELVMANNYGDPWE